jgi:hypothetical protein
MNGHANETIYESSSNIIWTVKDSTIYPDGKMELFGNDLMQSQEYRFNKGKEEGEVIKNQIIHKIIEQFNYEVAKLFRKMETIKENSMKSSNIHDDMKNRVLKPEVKI